MKDFRAIEINVSKESLKERGFLKVLYDADIFINSVPILKSIVLANILVWIIMYLTF